METIKITELDYSRLSNLVESTKKTRDEELLNLSALKEEIARAEVVSPEKIAREFVTMNSLVEILDLDTNRKMKIRLVYPREANFKKGNVSIFSLLGSALIGCREGDRIYFNAPSGRKNVQIIKILYQPEANGNFNI